MRSNAKSSIPSIPTIRDGWTDGMDVFKFICEGGRGSRSGSAETEGVSARQVRIGKKFARRRNHSTKPRCSEQRTGITKKCAYARFCEMPHGFVKSIPLTYEEGIDRRVSSGFEQNRFLHQTAKRMRWRAYPLRCFHHENLGGFYEHQK